MSKVPKTVRRLKVDRDVFRTVFPLLDLGVELRQLHDPQLPYSESIAKLPVL